MEGPDLIIEVTARFGWKEPPKDMAEKIIREQADVMAAAAADRLRTAVKLLVLELLNQKPL